ncbi:uncharacterized protein PV09_03947 [Verruconis gallopava]|uniref:Mitochondrial 2-oxoglutarate/malate carrier protein n=1 Tax=Verruconis gallopava TaxID=253628 RepID=A0A0D1YXK5_9PEZI|nr:uncharacterized protein PV09_03947 [Verruconis gallopava]KIW05437.1 hypothetical protein PV09_03947 [Verruconis gallopava]
MDGAGSSAVSGCSARGLTSSSFFKRCQPFLVGGSSGCIAIACVQPVDMIKVRLQLSVEGTKAGNRHTAFSIAREIVSNGRFFDLYNGLSAGLLRQVVYGTSRLGLFFTFEDLLKVRATEKGDSYGFFQRTLASLAAGGIGAMIGNPVEVALVRMQSDGLKPAAEQARYRSVFDALTRIVRTEGVPTLWSGAAPTMVRALATNFGQLTFFSESKARIQKHTKLPEKAQSVIASSIGGFFAAFFSLPFDFVKTRLQRQSKDTIYGKAEHYKGVIDCFVKVLNQEGPLRFYRGFWAYFLRIAPFTYVNFSTSLETQAGLVSKQF